MALTRDSLAKAVQEQTDLSKKDSTEAVETILDIMKRTLASGEDVLISGFGKFQVKDKDARRGRNPATGGDLMLRSRRIVTFKVSGKLREKVN